MSTGWTEADIPSLSPGRMLRMRELLAAALAPQALDIRDDSHLHAGHAGSRHGQGHFSVEIVSASFAGMSPAARHRMVYSALGELLQTDIHALSIAARTPGESG